MMEEKHIKNNNKKNEKMQEINAQNNISLVDIEIQKIMSNKSEFNQNQKKLQITKMSSELNSSLSTNYSNNSNNILDNSLNVLNKSIKINEKPKIEQMKINSDYLYNLEYFDEMYTNLLFSQNKAKLRIDKNYMNKQNYINSKMREILVDWIVEVHFHYNFKEKTLFQTIYIIDLFLSNNIIPKEKFQLLGAACLLISCKENEVLYPSIQDFINISNNSYTKKELLTQEKLVLKVLNFDILYPTSEEFYNILSRIFNFNKMQHYLGEYFLDSSLIDYNLLKYNASTISIACAYIVMKFYNMDGYKILYKSKMIIGQESKKIIKDCSRELCFLVKTLSRNSFQAVKNKYSSEKFGNIALMCEQK